MGERFGRVVAGAFFPVSPGQAVNEAAFGVTLRIACVGVGNDLVALVGLQLFSGHEVANFQLVVGGTAGFGAVAFVIVAIKLIVVAGFGGFAFLRCRLHFKQVFFGEEAAEAQQCFIDSPELVDAQL